MRYLPVAVATVGTACLLNMALTFALIRWMRRHAEQLTSRPPNRLPLPRLPAGARAPDFTTTTVTGETRSLSDLTGARSVLGFFSSRCPPCKGQLPEFKQYARTVPGGAARVLAVVSGDESEAGDFVAQLEGVASVVVEPMRGPTAKAFAVLGFPSFYVLDDRGVIEASGAAVHQVVSAELV